MIEKGTSGKGREIRLEKASRSVKDRTDMQVEGEETGTQQDEKGVEGGEEC